MKTGKEIKINKLKNYNVVFGSVNNRHPKAVYINVSAWSEPIDEDEINYSRIIKDINKKVRQSIFNSLDNNEYSDFLKDRTIVDFDIRESGIRFGKRSFMNCEITLFLNVEIPINSELMKPMLDNVLNKIENTFETNKSFNFFKKKK